MAKYSDVSGDVVRLAGLMVVGIGIAWALQSLGFGLLWVLGAAVVAGAGTGFICASDSEPDHVPVLLKSNRRG